VIARRGARDSRVSDLPREIGTAKINARLAHTSFRERQHETVAHMPVSLNRDMCDPPNSLAHMPKRRLAPILRHDHYMILTFPFHMG